MALVHTDVNSSNLFATDYDEDRNILIVTFRNADGTAGGKYAYEGVPADVHGSLLTAESAGAAFHKLIRQGGFEYKKV